jgi:hypothetical protein
MNKSYMRSSFALPAVYCYAYMDDTYGSAYEVNAWYNIFYISPGNIRNSEIAENACVYSGTDYAFLVLFYWESHNERCYIHLHNINLQVHISVSRLSMNALNRIRNSVVPNVFSRKQ